MSKKVELYLVKVIFDKYSKTYNYKSTKKPKVGDVGTVNVLSGNKLVTVTAVMKWPKDRNADEYRTVICSSKKKKPEQGS